MEKKGEADTTLQGGGEHIHEPDMEDTLPPFSPAHSPDFKWGEMEGVKVVVDIDMIYSEIVHWRHNLFKIPSGKQGLSRKWPDFSTRTQRHLHEAMAIKAAWFSQP